MSNRQDYNMGGHCPSCNSRKVKRRRTNNLIYCETCGGAFTDQEYRAHQQRVIGMRLHANAGLASRIRGSLKVVGPASALELAERLGVKVRSVREAIQQMLNRTGGIARVAGTVPHVYKVVEAARAYQLDAGSRIAGPITVGRGSRWGASWM